jgi:diguanylate cyclase (GGDEF)-like protein
MYRTFRNRIATHLEKRSIATDDEINLYLISFVAILFCMATHAYLLIAFAVCQSTLFTVLNVVSVCLYAGLVLLHKKRLYKAIALILTVDVSVYATVMIVLTGISNYVVGYYLLVIILQIILPYGSIRLRAIVIALIILGGLPGILYSIHHEPSVALSVGLQDFLTLSNIYILFIGAIMQLCIGNIVKRIIRQLNENRIDKLSALANADPLTGLFNRRYAESYFVDILETRKKTSYCVAMLDIDDFKLVNDTYGHGCGDEVLVFLAEFIVGSLRRSDLVFRWGGEEFLLVLENVDLPTAYGILDKLRLKLAQTTIHTDECNLKIAITIGVAVLDPEAPLESIKRSDMNLYVGKQKGKNVVIAG